MEREIQHLIGQMTEEERRAYLKESLFLSTVRTRTNELGAYMKKTGAASRTAVGRPVGGPATGRND